MCRKSVSNLSRWLLATAILIAISAGGGFFAGTAAACAPGAGQLCTQLSAGWKPILVDLHEQKARIEALRFAERVKRHLGRQFAKRKQQFDRHQARIEKRQRAHRRHSKARQFAAARRHAAKHVHRLRHALGAKPRKFGVNKQPGRQASGGSARHVPRWRSLWRHDAHNAAQPLPKAN
jgi:hypothetical protein